MDISSKHLGCGCEATAGSLMIGAVACRIRWSTSRAVPGGPAVAVIASELP